MLAGGPKRDDRTPPPPQTRVKGVGRHNNIAMGFNQRKPPDRTVCVAVDLSAVFDSLP